MNFIVQWSRSFQGVCVPLRLMNCLFPVPDSQPTTTGLVQSPLYVSGTVIRSKSHLLRGSAPIGAGGGGVMTPHFSRQRGTGGGHNLEIIHISHIALITSLH